MLKKRSKQVGFHDFPNGYHGARIFQDNRWVKLSNIVPWDIVEEEYAKAFTGQDTGNPSISSRMAFVALVIKKELDLSDVDTVIMIRENPHCQYFLGMPEFTNTAPFDSSKMVAFRKRFPAQAMARINEAIIQGSQKDPPDQPDQIGDSQDKTTDPTQDESVNKGTLLLDATCAPANIRYPTDTAILNTAREKSEQLLDALWIPGPGKKKPRTDRKRARKEYLGFVRRRRPSRKQIRQFIRKQLGYLGRNLNSIKKLQESNDLNAKQIMLLKVLQRVYRQQQQMYQKKQHRVDERIVSVQQPHVRPIVRGKQNAPTEFGAKVATSLADGYIRIEHLSWDAFNEGLTLIESCERFKERNGVYPEQVIADKLYRNRANLAYCKEHGIHLNGPRLGRPPKDKKLYAEQKLQERIDSRKRNAIEGTYGTAKTRYGLDRVMMVRSETSETEIHLTFLVMNLKKRLRDLFCSFFSKLFYRIFRQKSSLIFNRA